MLKLIIFDNLDFYFFKKTAQIAGGRKRYTKQYVELLPIIKLDDEIKRKKFEIIVSYILFLKNQTFKEVTDQLMPVYFEQIINGMVYELYFPELIQKHKREIIQHLGELPELTDKMNDEKKIQIIRTGFERLNQKEHPVRVNLFYMDSIPEIRIIEGKI